MYIRFLNIYIVLMCRQAAYLALMSYPGGLQLGGGVTAENAERYLEAGASHVIVTSYVFRDGRLDEERLQNLVLPHVFCCILFHPWMFCRYSYLCLWKNLPSWSTRLQSHTIWSSSTLHEKCKIVDNETQAMHRRTFWGLQVLNECIF